MHLSLSLYLSLSLMTVTAEFVYLKRCFAGTTSAVSNNTRPLALTPVQRVLARKARTAESFVTNATTYYHSPHTFVATQSATAEYSATVGTTMATPPLYNHDR